MNKEVNKLKDAGSERALIGTILKNGKDAFIDADGIVDSTDFALPINKALYIGLKNLADDPNCERFDTESLKLKLKALSMDEYIAKPKEQEYVELLDSTNFDKENIPMFALQIKKLSVARDLYTRYQDAISYLNGLTGNEALSDIIRNAESRIIDYISGVEDGASLAQLSENLEEYVQSMIDAPEVDQVGIPTGYPLWDDAIGGGQRKGTVNVVGARPKTGKSFHALNVALNTAKRGVPTLYLDTELTKPYQKNRMICINSGVPMNLFETGKFKHQADLVQAALNASKQIETIPLWYESIAGMSPSEVLAIARRWIVKHVGFNEKGEANDCLIIYDYLKLTSGEGLTKVTPEYILLGLMLTEMHNFAVRYMVPFTAYVQLNRDGIDGEDTSVIAGSDRILWLCSSMSILKNKDQTEEDLSCGWEYGNKKLVVLETRYGSGMEMDGDYINLHASLRPRVSKLEACGHIREGFLFSEVSSQHANPSDRK